MGYHWEAAVFAGHTVIFIAAILFWSRFIPLAAASRRAEVGPLALAPMPLAAALIVVAAYVEALYYGSARMLLDHGVNLWREYELVAALRIAVAASIYAHMPSYFRWIGLDPIAIRYRMGVESMGLALVWLAAFWIFW